MYRILDKDLRGDQFAGKEVSRVSFVNCTAEGAIFDHARLSDVGFEAAGARQVSFRGASFNGASMNVVYFGPRTLRLQETTYRGARLKEVTFMLSDLEGADFTGATLHNCYFRKNILRRVSFRDAKLNRVSFEGADLRDADFTGATFHKMEFWGEPDFTGAIIADELRYQFGEVKEALRKVDHMLSEEGVDIPMREALMAMRERYYDLLSAPEGMFIQREMASVIPPQLFPRILKRLKAIP